MRSSFWLHFSLLIVGFAAGCRIPSVEHGERDTGSSRAATSEPDAPPASHSTSQRDGAIALADIARYIDPAADGWRSEVQCEDAQKQLVKLGDLLGRARTVPSDVEGDFFDRCLLPPLRPGPRSVATLGGMRIERFHGRPESVGRTPPAKAFEEFLLPHGGNLRFEFRIAGVISHSDDDFVTDVLVHAFGSGLAGRVQQNARWVVSWVLTQPSEADVGPIARTAQAAEPKELTARVVESANTASSPRIVSIMVMQYEEIASIGPAYVDGTRDVIRDDALWQTLREIGRDDRRGRVDGVRLESKSISDAYCTGNNGIAIGDVNGDGLEDVYLAMGAGMPNRLLVQQSDSSVRDTAADAGLDWLDDTWGVLLIDWDNDGDADLVSAIGATIVFHENDGRGRFKLRHTSRATGSAPFGSLAAADYDLDGDLDIYACRNVAFPHGDRLPIPLHDATNGPPDVLLRNDGDAGFVDVTSVAGLTVNNNRFSIAAAWADYDNDGDPDLYVSNEFGRNGLYRNDAGKFVDVAAMSGAENQAIGRGVSWADFDGDGDLDLYVSNAFSAEGNRIVFQPHFLEGTDPQTRIGVQRLAQGSALLINQGNGTFLDRADDAGVRISGWANGAKFVDFDNDGREDLIVPNGFISGPNASDLSGYFWRRVASQDWSRDLNDESVQTQYARRWSDLKDLLLAGYSWGGRERNRCYVNLGDGTFVDVSGPAGVDLPDDARAMAVVDWDGDGHLDVWMRNRSDPSVRFWRNAGTAHGAGRSVSIRLVGVKCNRDAVGAKLTARIGDRTLVRLVSAGDGYLSQSSRWVHFGLGEVDRLDELTIVWPSPSQGGDAPSLVERHVGIAAGRYEIKQGAATHRPWP